MKPLRDRHGLSVGSVITFHGVGEGTAEQSESRQGFPGDCGDAEEMFRLFLEHCPTSSWIMDGDGRFEYVSPTYRRMFRIPAGDVVGKTVFDLYPARIAGSTWRARRRSHGGPARGVGSPDPGATGRLRSS